MIKVVKDYDFKVSRLDTAIQITNQILSDQRFYERIRNKEEPFDARYTEPGATPKYIADKMIKSDAVLKVRTYTGWWRPSYGKTFSNQPGVFYVNISKLNRSMPSIVATNMHEVAHLLDMVTKLDFHHNGNNPSGKSNTFQFWVDELAQEMAKDILRLPGKEKTPSREKHHYGHSPFYKRAWKWVKNILF